MVCALSNTVESKTIVLPLLAFAAATASRSAHVLELPEAQYAAEPDAGSAVLFTVHVVAQAGIADNRKMATIPQGICRRRRYDLANEEKQNCDTVYAPCKVASRC
jgi:hypothetical protein